MTVAIVDYGMGNLGSVRRAIQDLGADVIIASSPSQLDSSSQIILPGVGGFSKGMALLNSGGWTNAIKIASKSKFVFGICLGMQMLASWGDEGERTNGLDLIDGSVVRLDKFGCTLRIPHVGWNDVAYKADCRLFNNIPMGSDFYFVHSYAFNCTHQDNVAAHIDYGVSITAAVKSERVYGTQFHPEKSSKVGRSLLENFLELSSC